VSQTRRDAPQRIRRALAANPAGLSVRELADVSGLHENAVRRTLAKLVAEGAVVVERQQAQSRGRPLLRYRVVGSREEPFKGLVPLLLELVAAGDGSAEAAYAVGRAHGASAGARVHGSARERVAASLARLGFAPVERPSGHAGRVTFDLMRCPFADSVNGPANGRTICHLHHGYLAGVAHASRARLEEFVIGDPRATPCRVALGPAEAA
jgi:predicted ArsR family transcriptional regulator